MERAIVQELTQRLNADAERIARHFGLRYRSITAERKGVNSHYGICYSDGAIRIRLRHATSGRPLKYSSLVNTLCHELAHLRHFDHSPAFREFYFQILDYARAQGIYRPGRPARRGPAAAPRRRVPSGPEQLGLFSR